MADERSDVDLLVTMDADCSLWDLGGLWSDLNDVLGGNVEVIPDDHLKPRARPNIFARSGAAMRLAEERFRDALEAVEKIEERAILLFEEFTRDEVLQVWMIHHLQIIGEALRAVDLETRARFPEIAWSEIIGMRHVLVHGYFRINPAAVWQAVTEDVPAFKLQIKSAIRSFASPPENV